MIAKQAIVLNTEAMLALELDGIKLIEASAGTGKTYTIANLYLRHILTGKTPSEILVVTFTNAATEELRGRIRLRLHQALMSLQKNKPSGDEFLQRLQAQFRSLDSEQQKHQTRILKFALRHMDESAISTIHGFCQRVLQNYAVPSRQFFENELVIDDTELWQSAIKDWWRKHTYTLDKTDWLILQDSTGGVENLIRNLDEMRQRSSYDFLPRSESSLNTLLSSSKTIVNKLKNLSDLWRTHRSDIVQTLTASPVLSRTKKLPYHKDTINNFIDDFDSYFEGAIQFPLPEDFKYLASDVLQENSKPSKRGSDPGLEHVFFQTANAIQDHFTQLKTFIRPQALIEAYEFGCQQLKLLKQKGSLLSYQDQLELVLDALRGIDGLSFAKLLRQKFPVAMIDEFQDTDAIQFEIFKQLYFGHNATSLTLIGDPKQAIYSFRGGDIFTYMQARLAKGVQLYSLQTNWRSSRNLVEAVNCFFDRREDSFIFSESIQFTPAQATGLKPTEELQISGQPQTALTLWHIPRAEDGKLYNKTITGNLLNQAVAGEIGRLISGGLSREIKIGEKALQSGDIAILVRNAYQGESLRQTLAFHGIAAVTIGKDKVFDSEEAQGLSTLLKAVARYSNRQILRQALSSELLNFHYDDIARIVENDTHWQDWVDHFRQLHAIWLARGFIPMFQQLLQKFEIGLKLADRDKPERRLTNLLQIGELLQQQSLHGGGIDSLLSWLKQQTLQPLSTESELRLESDSALVKIVTIHKSKGLEYPVIFLPYLWDCKSIAQQKDGILAFHDSTFKARLDLGSSDFQEHALVADKERLAEDIRLLYVALTRARCKVYLAWGEAGAPNRPGNSSQTALAYLLHSQQTAQDLNKLAARGFDKDTDMLADLQDFADTSNGNIELLALPVDTIKQHFIDQQSSQKPELATFESVLQSAWRINSFSGLTRDVHQIVQSSGSPDPGDAILNFPAGSQVGLLLHLIFENLDFCGDIESQCKSLLQRYSMRYALDITAKEDILVDWINQVLGTTLIQPGLNLAVLKNQQRLNELAFDFALDELNIDQLNDFFAHRQAAPKETISAQNFRGLMTGIIDLVFEYKGRFYLADYKSNLLGSSLNDYTPDKLQQAMLDRRYDLQLLIYSIALHRYLGQRILNYDFEAHFGGAYYLFLRAMRIESGAKYGVFFERPTLAEIEKLDKLFSYMPCRPGI